MWIKAKIEGAINKKRERWLVENADKIEITDLKNLSFRFYNSPNVDMVVTNFVYGHMWQLKQYAGIAEETKINCTIEHGCSMDGHYVNLIETSQPTSKILTQSVYRKELIERLTDLEAVPIGPYIAYAKPYYSEEKILEEKKKAGRTLLVFPAHSSEPVKAAYDRKAFLMEIDNIAKDFNRVMVCLYYKDIINGEAEEYIKKGYTVVSAGFLGDKYFLSRLKTILQLSDAVMSNECTTGVIYGIFLNKPGYIFRQEVEYGVEDRDTSLDFEKYKVNTEKFCEILSDRKFGNLKEQREFVSYYHGFEQVKSKEQIKNILNSVIR